MVQGRGNMDTACWWHNTMLEVQERLAKCPPGALLPSTVAAEPEPYVVGNSYRTQGGEWVKIVGKSGEGTHHETIVDEHGVHRYTGASFLRGRATGSEHDYSHPKNIRPLYAVDPFVESDALSKRSPA